MYDPKPNIPEGFVDFGLPSGTLWYNKNIGATNGSTKESWYGNYYAWGETETKESYTWSNYKFGTEDKLTKYNSTDGKTVLEAVDDVATVTNSAWRMPTKENFIELVAGTVSSWVENYNNIEGLSGRVFVKLTGTQPAFKNITLYSELFGGEVTDDMWAGISGYTLEELNALVGGDIREMMFKDAELSILADYGTDYGFTVKQTDPSFSMFVPAAGYFEGSSVKNVRNGAWSSSCTRNNSNSARNLSFNNQMTSGDSGQNRCIGYPVRPVLSAS